MDEAECNGFTPAYANNIFLNYKKIFYVEVYGVDDFKLRKYSKFKKNLRVLEFLYKSTIF